VDVTPDRKVGFTRGQVAEHTPALEADFIQVRVVAYTPVPKAGCIPDPAAGFIRGRAVVSTQDPAVDFILDRVEDSTPDRAAVCIPGQQTLRIVAMFRLGKYSLSILRRTAWGSMRTCFAPIWIEI